MNGLLAACLFVCLSVQTAAETYLIEIGKGGDLIPERLHDELVFVQTGRVDFALAFDDGGTEGHALEIVVVQEAIVVNVCKEGKVKNGRMSLVWRTSVQIDSFQSLASYR